MLKYRADLRTLLFVTTYFLLTWALWVYWVQLSMAVRVFIIMLLSFLSFICAVAVHNTIHVPVFKNKMANRFFQIILSLSYGHSVSPFVVGHNHSHHKFLGSKKDIARTTKLRFKWNLLNQLLFFPMTTFDILSTELKWARRMLKSDPSWLMQYIVELIIVYGIKLGLLLIDWQLAIFIIFIPHYFAQWGIIGTNYWQHDGCDLNHRYNHSRNFTSPYLNFFFLNNGFHGLHHERPDLHWSLLPKVYHQEFGPYVHPNLNRYSLAAYIFESYIYPGKRIDFLGNKVELPRKEEDKDEDWVDAVLLDGSEIKS